MTDLHIHLVKKDELQRFWPSCESLIDKGLIPAQGEANTKHLLSMLEAGLAHLIAGVDESDIINFALVVQFQQLPNYKIAHVFSIGGRGVVDKVYHWSKIKAWMKTMGAIKVQGVCRPSQARLWSKLGFKVVYQVVREDL
jgi:hypothetical protein